MKCSRAKMEKWGSVDGVIWRGSRFPFPNVINPVKAVSWCWLEKMIFSSLFWVCEARGWAIIFRTLGKASAMAAAYATLLVIIMLPVKAIITPRPPPLKNVSIYARTQHEIGFLSLTAIRGYFREGKSPNRSRHPSCNMDQTSLEAGFRRASARYRMCLDTRVLW